MIGVKGEIYDISSKMFILLAISYIMYVAVKF